MPPAVTRPQSAEDWQVLMDTTLKMLSLAQSKDWQGLKGLVLERHQLLQAFFACTSNPDLAQQIKDGLITMQEIDHKIMQLTQVNKQRMGEALGKLQTGKNMAKQYKAASRSR